MQKSEFVGYTREVLLKSLGAKCIFICMSSNDKWFL